MMPGFLRTSVRRKTLAVVLGTVFVALLVNAVVLLVFEVRAFREGHVIDLRTQAEIVGRAAAPALAFNDRKAADQDLLLLAGREDVTAAAVYDVKGTVFASYTQAGARPAPPQPSRPGYEFGRDSLEVFHPVMSGQENVGTVYVRASLGLEDRVLRYLGVLAATTALAFAVAWLLSSWLQRSLTGPIQDVAGAARVVVEQRDLSARAKKTTDDEVGLLADAFNRMLAELEREIGERREAEKELRTADQLKDEFLATLAHELRNPLAPIRNALYLLDAPRTDEAARARLRAMMERQLNQLIRLVDDLLDVSRITTGKLGLRRGHVDLLSVASSALESITPLARARGISVRAELPPQGCIVDADATRLAQLFLNLLNNAVKFSADGGTVEFSVSLEGADLIARVRDQGVGIAKEDLERIFQMFVQVDRSLERSTMGLGVGLALARRLAELHGGTVTAQSDGLGRGAEFRVRIPNVAIAVATDGLAQGQSPGLDDPGRRRILIADDNVDFAETLAIMLRSLGHEVHVVHDGETALARAAAIRPQVAFLDIGMPKMNGYEVAKLLRAGGSTRTAVLVAVTGWGQPQDRARALAAGFNEHMVKPVDIARVADFLRQVPA
jgi:signal transduction histidine kinase